MDSIKKTGRNAVLAALVGIGASGCENLTAKDLEDIAIGVGGAALGAHLDEKGDYVAGAAVRGATGQHLNRENAEAGRTTVIIQNSGQGDLKTYTCEGNGARIRIYMDGKGNYRDVENGNPMSCERVY